jgi:hypothetical protein
MNTLTKGSPIKVIQCVTVHGKPLIRYYDIETQGIQTTNDSLILYKMISQTMLYLLRLSAGD